MESEVQKQCSKCKSLLPATNEYFRTMKKGKLGLSSWCKPCGRAYDKEYQKKNRDKRIAQNKEWRDKNPNRAKEYYAENQEKVKQYMRDNRERYKVHQKTWATNNRDKIALKSKVRRERIASLPNTLTEEQWEYTQQCFNNSCAYCTSTDELEKDHLVSVVKGGGYVLGNIIPACKDCNSRKQDRDFTEWYSTYEHYNKERETKILKFMEEEL